MGFYAILLRNFSIVINQSGLLDTFLYTTNALTSGVNYFWRVGRMDAQDSLYWSETWTFKVIGVSTDEVLEEEMSLKIYPNPLQDYLIIEAEAKISDEFLHLQLYNLNGQLIQQKYIPRTGNIKTQLRTGELASGIYILKIRSRNRIKTVKLIK